jgi:hypothetical protein
MKPLDWKELGRFNSVLLNLFSIVRDVFSGMKIGIEIVGWLTTGGKEILVRELEALGTAYHAAHPVEVIDEKSIRVNLDAPPKMPFDGPFTGIKSKTGSGWVMVEKREDGLYVDGRKVILWISKRKGITGYELREEVLGKPVLHPNILDALLEYPQLIPEEWKEKSKGGYTRYIFFWGVVFFRHTDNLYVRQLFYDGGGEWGSIAKCLSDGLPFDGNPVALLSNP